MARPITKLELAGFRGATAHFELSFNPAKTLTVLFGENGSGKSTILDAIDVVFNKNLGSLEGVSAGQNRIQYLPTVGAPPSTLQVRAHSGDVSWTATVQHKRLSVVGPEDMPHVRVLRRNKVLLLVTAQPAERYDALKRFIDVGVVEQSEKALQKKLQSIGKEIDRLVESEQNYVEQLEQAWNAEAQPGSGSSATKWAEEKVGKGIAHLNSQLSLLKTALEVVKNAVVAAADHDTKKSIAAGCKEALEEIEERIRDTPGLSAANAIRLIESLTKAKQYIDNEPALDRCPTCQRPILRDRLVSIVESQLNQMKELKELNDQRNQALKKLNKANTDLVATQETFVTAMRDLQATIAGVDIPEVLELAVRWPDWSTEKTPLEALHPIAKAFESLEPALQLRRDGAQRDVNQFNFIKQTHENIREAHNGAEELSRIQDGLQRTFNLIHEKRLAFTQQILDDIAGEANRLFHAIHPDEDIDLEALSMDQSRRSSIEQIGVFHGHKDVPPQAVFSDSHLDTLGFCVWLALAKRESPESTVVVIDDIFSSVDAPHLIRVVDLLSQECHNFLQVIVATHYRLWWDRCQGAGNIQRIHLGSWTMEHGISAKHTPLITDELQNLLAKPVLDRQAVSSKSGVLLERTLDEIAFLYKRPLPRNKLGQYTLGELAQACSKVFSKYRLTVKRNIHWDDGEPEEWETMDVTVPFHKISDLKFIRNQVGCHFNVAGLEISDADVRRFGCATLDFVNALTCPSCGYLATKVANDGTHLRCSCPKRPVRMTPVTIR